MPSLVQLPSSALYSARLAELVGLRCREPRAEVRGPSISKGPTPRQLVFTSTRHSMTRTTYLWRGHRPDSRTGRFCGRDRGDRSAGQRGTHDKQARRGLRRRMWERLLGGRGSMGGTGEGCTLPGALNGLSLRPPWRDSGCSSGRRACRRRPRSGRARCPGARRRPGSCRRHPDRRIRCPRARPSLRR